MPPTAAPEPGSASSTAADRTVWRRSPDAAFVESEGRAVVVDLTHLDRAPYVFEGSAAEIWACVDGDRTEAELVADLSEAFEVPRDAMARDVREFLDRLRDLGLVVAVGA